MFQPNEEVTTPDRGDGIVIGLGMNNKIIVRVNEQQPYHETERVKTFRGWQYEYDEDQLKPADPKKRR